MYTKQCSRCMKQSYSSNNLNQWKCPYCANELKGIKAIVVNHSVNLSLIDKRITKQRGLAAYRQLPKFSMLRDLTSNRYT